MLDRSELAIQAIQLGGRNSINLQLAAGCPDFFINLRA